MSYGPVEPRVKNLLLAEDLILLITDDQTGSRRHVMYPDILASGALITDLVTGGFIRLTEEGERVGADRVVIDPAAGTPQHPSLAVAWHVAASQTHWSPTGLITKLTTRTPTRVLYQGLAQAGVLRQEERSFMGIITWNTWPAIVQEHEQLMRQRLVAVLTGMVEPDPRCGSLIALLTAERAAAKVLLRGMAYDKGYVRSRSDQLLQSHWPARALKTAIANASNNSNATYSSTITLG